MTAAAGFLVVALALALEVAAIVRAGRREARARRDVLADCVNLLDGATLAVGPSGHGALRGTRDGRTASLTPIAEAMAFRRLPQLWIAAALRADLGGPSVEILRRPTGAEIFTGGAGLPTTFAPPAGWPPDTGVRGSRDAGAIIERLAPLLAGPLSDPRLKAVTVSPGGVRVVRQAAQGERGAYLLFRDTHFPEMRVAPQDAAAALDLALDLRGALEREASPRQTPDVQASARAA